MRINSSISYPLPPQVTPGRTPDNQAQPPAEGVTAPDNRTQPSSPPPPPQPVVPGLTRDELAQLNGQQQGQVGQFSNRQSGEISQLSGRNASTLETEYDEPSRRNLKAVNSYQDIVNSPRREEIQSLVGIDVYA